MGASERQLQQDGGGCSIGLKCSLLTVLALGLVEACDLIGQQIPKGFYPTHRIF